jgi:(p)ppGpp synthase/HD superfamily hydrolase
MIRRMTLSTRFEDALVFATQLHAEQVRKATAIPYVSHLMSVSALVLEHGGSEDEAIGALLHDAVEDQGGRPTLDTIAQRFGPAVAAIVEGCTDSEAVPKPPWRKRKEAYVAHIATASPSVRLVSSADKLHNARCILADYRVVGEALWDRFTGGRDGTLWYYRSLVEAFRAAGGTPLLPELERVVAELERLSSGGSRPASG